MTDVPSAPSGRNRFQTPKSFLMAQWSGLGSQLLNSPISAIACGEAALWCTFDSTTTPSKAYSSSSVHHMQPRATISISISALVLAPAATLGQPCILLRRDVKRRRRLLARML